MPFTSETAKLHRGRGGRKRKEPQEVVKAKQMAADIAREYIETHVQPVLDTYGKLATGWTEKRFSLSGNEYEVFKYDSQTTRHFIDKLLPEIKPDGINRPIAIQIIHEVAAIAVNGNGHHPEANGSGNGVTIHLGGE